MKSGSRAVGSGLPGESVPRYVGQRGVWWPGLERKWWVLASVGTSTFISALNASIINTIASVIMLNLGVDLATAGWFIMTYLVVLSGLLLTFGRMGDMAGHKRIYVVGFAIFTAGGVGCGLASSAPLLIGMRGLQAVGGAMILAVSPAILISTFPASQRGQVLGLQGTMTYLGLMMGPAVGGYLTAHFGWQSAFLINLPAGLLALGLAYVAIPDERPADRGERFDLLGAVVFLVALTAVLLGVSYGQNWGWTSGWVLALLAGGIALLALFVGIERRVPHPMLDLSLFHSRLFSASTVSALMNYTCLFGAMFLGPIYLIQFRELSPADAGLLISTQALVMAVSAPLAGYLSDRIGSRLLATLGMAISTVGLVGMSLLGSGSGTLQIIAALALPGLGAGVFVSPNGSAMLGSVPPQRRGIASAVLAAARSVGMVMGIALSGAALAVALAAHGGAIGPGEGFLPAFRDALRVVALCGVVGTLTSFVRGSHTRLAATKPGRQGPLA